MNLIEVLRKYQSEILENGVLIEYDLFFQNLCEGCSRFSIDEHEDLEELKNVLINLKKRDGKAEIYVCTYEIDFMDERPLIYGDTLWIDTILDLKELESLFVNCRQIEPSDIALLSDDEMMDGTIALVIMSDNNSKDYSSFIQEKRLCNIKSLYWD